MAITASSGRATDPGPVLPGEPAQRGASGAHGASAAGERVSAAAQPAALTTEAARRMGRTPGSRFSRGAASVSQGQGAAAAAKAVADDLQQLVRAELAYAKSEVADAAKAKGLGIGLLAFGGVVAWLGVQGLLITIAFAIAAAGLPGWAAAGIVTLVLLLVAGVAALVAKRKLSQPLSLDPAKERVEEDVTWIKSHLPTK